MKSRKAFESAGGTELEGGLGLAPGAGAHPWLRLGGHGSLHEAAARVKLHHKLEPGFRHQGSRGNMRGNCSIPQRNDSISGICFNRTRESTYVDTRWWGTWEFFMEISALFIKFEIKGL